MRISIVLLCLIFIGNKNVVSQNYKEKFKADICNCFQHGLAENDKISKQAYKKCFDKNLIKYAVFIDAEIEEENIRVKYRKGQLARQELRKKFKHELVYSCDVYFNSIEDERRRIKLQAQSVVYTSDIERLNQQIAMTPNSANYFKRGKVNFYLGNLKNAEADVRESLKLSKPYGSAMYSALLAWILEEQKRYSEAVAIYSEINTAYYNSEIEILKAVANKKAGGTATNLNKEKSELDLFLKNQKNEKTKDKFKKKDSISSLRKLFKIDDN